jgi:hypothetical protein
LACARSKYSPNFLPSESCRAACGVALRPGQ